MASRILWDKYETAILIEAYTEVENGKVIYNDAIKYVSNTLRERAINLGYEIDDIFRNENGINMQMKIIEGLFRNGTSKLHKASPVFYYMVELYNTNRYEFKRILYRAKRESGMTINMFPDFKKWLLKRHYDSDIVEIVSSCSEIEKIFLDKKVLEKPLFETVNINTINVIQNTIKNNVVFRLKNINKCKKMYKAITLYGVFLREIKKKYDYIFDDKILFENNDVEEIASEYFENEDEKKIIIQENEVESKSDGIINNQIDSIEKNISSEIDYSDDTIIEDNSIIEISNNSKEADSDIFLKNDEIYENAEKNIDEIKGCLTNIEDEREDYVWTFADEDVCFEKSVPSKLVFCEEEIIVTGWSDVYVRIIKNVYDNNPEVIYSLAGCNLSKINRIIISSYSDVEKLQRVTLLNNTLFLEVALNIEEMVYVIRKIIALCNIDLKNIKIKYSIKEFSNHSPVQDMENTSKEESFFSNGDKEDDIIISENKNNNFSQHDDKKEIQETKMEVVNNQKNGFEKWMTEKVGSSPNIVKSYSSAISFIGQIAKKYGYSKIDLFYIVDYNKVNEISQKLFENSEFIKINTIQRSRFQAALSRYWEYCKDMQDSFNDYSLNDRTECYENDVRKKRIAFIEWAQSQNMRKAVVLGYLSDLKKCSDFAKEKKYYDGEHIILIENSSELENLFAKMRKDDEFVRLNRERYNRLVPVMNKLIAFCKATGRCVSTASDSTSHVKPAKETTQHSDISIKTSAIDSKLKERYIAILANNFVDGFRHAKAIDRNRFKMYYNDTFGEELIEDDERLVRTLMKIGTLREERIFVKDESEQKDLIEEINETIIKTFKEGATCVYLDCLFARFQEQLAEMLHIYNMDSLESILFSSGKRNYFKKYNYLFEHKKEPAPTKDVIEYMKKSHLPVTYSEIENVLWYIPLDKVKHTLVTTPSIVNVASESYLYAPNLPVSESEIQQIEELISYSLLQRNYISDVELMQLIEEHCPSVLMNTPDYPMWGLRNALAYLLRDKFSFRGAIISSKDEEISMAEVFSDFCQRSEHITVDELKQFASELNTVIYWDSVYREMVRINQNEFVRRDQIHFDIDRTDSVLDNLIHSVYAPIKTINLFLHFPTIEVPWNNFVLESFVAHYSKKFKLLHASHTATDCCGAIVRQDSGISDYRTLIVDVLAKNIGWKNKNDALQLLVDLGYQQRRSYGDIEKVLQEAKARMIVLKK